MLKVLLVEDDKDLADSLKSWLQSDECLVDIAADGNYAVDSLHTFAYDIIVLDWELPGVNGIDILKRFRASGGATPVIMLTAKDKLDEKELGLGSGADDYLTKPFHCRELSARIRALMRRPPVLKNDILCLGSLELNRTAHSVRLDGIKIEMLPKEFALLEFFMRNPGQVFSPQAILDRLWSSDSECNIDTIYTWIKRLRAKIDKGRKQSMIKTIYGFGYKMEDC